MPRLSTLAPLLAMLIGLPFVLHAAGFGLRGLVYDLTGETRFYTAPLPNALIFTHMTAGALATLLAPVQLIATIRTRWPALHRRTGYVVLIASVLTGIAGLGYIALNGTIGGPLMSAGFALYGALILLAAGNTVYHALDKNIARHRAWGMRLAVLALGSFLYRLHYGLWYAATDGLWSDTEAFDGAFDIFNFAGFYLPYLFALELWLRRHPLSRRAPQG